MVAAARSFVALTWIACASRFRDGPPRRTLSRVQRVECTTSVEARVRIAAIALVQMSVAGCAMSESSWHRLGEESGLQNEKAYVEAQAALERRGYRYVPEETRHLSLDEAGREVCASDRSVDASTDSALLTLYVGEASRPGRPAGPPVQVTVPARTACAFIAGRHDANELVVTREGSLAELTRVPDDATLARAPDGALVYVVSRPRVTTRRVRVDTTCNRMPTDSDTYDRLYDRSVRVRWSTGETKPPPEVPLVYDTLTFDVDCTKYVY